MANQYLNSITVEFRDRDDGGLQAFSDDVPTLILSNLDPKVTIAKVSDFLQEILTRWYGVEVVVTPLEFPSPIPRFVHFRLVHPATRVLTYAQTEDTSRRPTDRLEASPSQ
jgi:hypothetical protein